MTERRLPMLSYSRAELVARLVGPIERALRAACADLAVVPAVAATSDAREHSEASTDHERYVEGISSTGGEVALGTVVAAPVVSQPPPVTAASERLRIRAGVSDSSRGGARVVYHEQPARRPAGFRTGEPTAGERLRLRVRARESTASSRYGEVDDARRASRIEHDRAAAASRGPSIDGPVATPSHGIASSVAALGSVSPAQLVTLSAPAAPVRAAGGELNATTTPMRASTPAQGPSPSMPPRPVTSAAPVLLAAQVTSAEVPAAMLPSHRHGSIVPVRPWQPPGGAAIDSPMTQQIEPLQLPGPMPGKQGSLLSVPRPPLPGSPDPAPIESQGLLELLPLEGSAGASLLPSARTHGIDEHALATIIGAAARRHGIEIP